MVVKLTDKQKKQIKKYEKIEFESEFMPLTKKQKQQLKQIESDFKKANIFGLLRI